MAPIEYRRWKHGILVAIICLAFPYALYYSSIFWAIYRTELTYNDHLGWIDWDHAKTEGPAALLQNLEKCLQRADTIAYRQQLRMASVKAVVEKRFVVKNLSEANKEPVAYAIFTSVSHSFEAMQAEFPFNLIPFISLAAFDDEDENGNNIAFYCACKGIRTADFKAGISKWPAGAAMWLFVRQRMGIAKRAVQRRGAGAWEEYQRFFDALRVTGDGTLECVETFKKVSFLKKACTPLPTGSGRLA